MRYSNIDQLNKYKIFDHAFVGSAAFLVETQFAVTVPVPFLRSVFTAVPRTAVISSVSPLVRLLKSEAKLGLEYLS
jgi:hypothetical protein